MRTPPFLLSLIRSDLAVSFSGAASYLVPCELSAALPAFQAPPLSLSAEAIIDLALLTDDLLALAFPSRQATATSSWRIIQQQQGLQAPALVRPAAQAMLPLSVGSRFFQQHMEISRRGVASRYAEMTPLSIGLRVDFQDTIRVQPSFLERYTQTIPAPVGLKTRAQETLKPRPSFTCRHQESGRTQRGAVVRAQHGLKAYTRLHVRYQHAEKPQAREKQTVWAFTGLGIRQKQGMPPQPFRCFMYRTPRGHQVWLRFLEPYTPQAGAQVGFQWCRVFEPKKKPEVYVVVNSFSLVRADNGQPIDALDFSASIDADSWGWSWNATVPASQMERVRSPDLGEFVEVVVTLNEIPLRLIVERMSRSREFGRASLKVSGRSRAAWLAEPRSPTGTWHNTEDRTAQQLLDDVLSVNGIHMGWGIDWQVEDWLVPAGAWSHSGNYMSAAQRIAEAAGAYVQAHNTDETLRILPYYPAPPWAWSDATPDFVLPENICLVEDME